jgi:hypothetical protein
MAMQRTTGTHWVFRLIPPRPTFDQDLTDAEREIMGQHAMYWAQIAETDGSSPTARCAIRAARGGWA